MAEIILKFCGSFFVNYVFYDFFRGQLKPRVKERKRIFLILLLCSAAIRVVNSFGSSFANLVFGPVILMVQMLLLFQDDGKRALFLLLIGETAALLLEIVTSLFIARFPLWALIRATLGYNQEAENFLMGILAYMLCWLVLHGLKVYFLSTKCAIGEHFPLSFFMLPLSTTLIYLGLFFNDAGGKWVQYCLSLGYILLPAANILMFYTIQKLFFISEKNREQQLTEQQAVLQQRYYQHLEEIDLGHRRYTHDLKNCLASIGTLAAAGGNEEIMALIGDMDIALDTLIGQRYTASPILNALLWEKEAMAKRYGIQMDIQAQTDPEWACISGRDLIVMTGNLLDNAIEAAKQHPEGHVYVALYAGEHFLVAEIENTCSEQVHMDGKTYLSTKPDASNHGFGLSNVRDTVQKYGGTVYTEQKDGHFIAVLTIAKICLTTV